MNERIIMKYNRETVINAIKLLSTFTKSHTMCSSAPVGLTIRDYDLKADAQHIAVKLYIMAHHRSYDVRIAECILMQFLTMENFGRVMNTSNKNILEFGTDTYDFNDAIAKTTE